MSVVLRASADGWANESQPSTNYAQSARLWMNDTTGSDARFAYLYFALPAGLLGSTILEATLRVYLSGSWTGSQAITASRVTEAWRENRLTYNNKPSYSATNQAGSGTITTGLDETEITFNIEDMLADVAAGDAWYGVRLEVNTNANRAVYSTQYVDIDLRPQLELDWSLAPYPPTGLGPAGDRAITANKPTVFWSSGDAVQTASQVQIHSTSVFTTPDYDSGKEVNELESWDLNAATSPVFGGITSGTTKYMRVKIWNEADVPSEYSDTVSFTRQALGTVTITNPPVGETVNELTPPIAWTFSGTQRAAGIRVWEIDENGARELLYERRRHRTDDTSITLPMNVLKSGHDYRVEVTVTDGIDRQGMTRDERVASAERDFTYVRGGVTAVSALTATGNGPGVTLAWTRAGTAPDYFALRVDDEEVDDYQRIDPTEVGSSAQLLDGLLGRAARHPPHVRDRGGRADHRRPQAFERERDHDLPLDPIRDLLDEGRRDDPGVHRRPGGGRRRHRRERDHLHARQRPRPGPGDAVGQGLPRDLRRPGALRG